MSQAAAQKQKLLKRTRTEDDEFLDSALEQSRIVFNLNRNQKIFFFCFAYLTTFLPSYLYQGVKGLDFSGLTIALYLSISSIAAFLLSLAYENIFLRTRVTLSERFDKVISEAKGSIGKLNKQTQSEYKIKKDKLTELGTTGYTLFLTNLIFIIVSLFLGFYALSRADVRVNYVASLLGASGLVYWLSSTRRREA
ncbi:translocon-associated protein subunit SSR3 [Acrasis kona]|uniref:Translocon-associated protein subunit SSR3 n=1 Tax=Acrasis kona TaxID=1008807 RepID=A0AAW2ZML3_9EUKA